MTRQGFTESRNHNPMTPMESVQHLGLRGKSTSDDPDVSTPKKESLSKGRVPVKVRLAEAKATQTKSFLPKPVLGCSHRLTVDRQP